MPSTCRETRVTLVARSGVLISKAGFTCPGHLGTCTLKTSGSQNVCPFGPLRFLHGFAQSIGSVILETPCWVTNR